MTPPHEIPSRLSRPVYHVLWLAPLALLLAATLGFRLTSADHWLAARFWDAEQGEFAFPFWGMLLYEFSGAPGLILSIGSLLAYIGSFWLSRLRRWRPTAVFLALAMIAGPGLVINSGFKMNYPRPRPIQVQDFGGELLYHPVWTRGQPEPINRSFPSGHASTAFYLMTPFFLLVGRLPGLAALFLVGGAGYGALVGLARMSQGGHWASDVLWSGGLVYFTGFVLASLFGFLRASPAAR